MNLLESKVCAFMTLTFRSHLAGETLLDKADVYVSNTKFCGAQSHAILNRTKDSPKVADWSAWLFATTSFEKTKMEPQWVSQHLQVNCTCSRNSCWMEAYLLGRRDLTAGASTSLAPLGSSPINMIFILGEWSISCSQTAITPAETADAVSSVSVNCNSTRHKSCSRAEE